MIIRNMNEACMLSNNDLDIELRKYEVALGIPTGEIVILNQPGFPVVAPDPFIDNPRFLLNLRINEIRLFKVKERQANLAYLVNQYDKTILFRRKTENKKRVETRKNLHAAMVEARELVEAINQLKVILAMIDDTDLKIAATTCFEDARRLAVDFLSKNKITPSKEKKWLTDVVNNIRELCADPTNITKRDACTVSFSAMPSYKPGWRTLQENGMGFLLVTVFLSIFALIGSLHFMDIVTAGAATFFLGCFVAVVLLLNCLKNANAMLMTDNELLHRTYIIGPCGETDHLDDNLCSVGYRARNLFKSLPALDKAVDGFQSTSALRRHSIHPLLQSNQSQAEEAKVNGSDAAPQQFQMV